VGNLDAVRENNEYIFPFQGGFVAQYHYHILCPVCKQSTLSLYQSSYDMEHYWMCTDCWTTRADNPGMFELITLARMAEATNG